MSIHYSRYDLDTYRGTPYFQAQVPAGYPLDRVLQQGRAFRRLPPRLRELSVLAKKWAIKANPGVPAGIPGIEDWYDDEGYELDPSTKKRLTDEQIDEEWDRWEIPKVKVEDIPAPAGGFADPDTWQEPPPAPQVQDGSERPSDEQLLSDIRSHGREATAREYGIPVEQLPAQPALAMDATGAVVDGQSGEGAAVVSRTELVAGGVNAPVTPNAQVLSTAKDANKCRVERDWDDLRVIAVGVIENNVFAPVPWQPSVAGLPREGGISYEDFAPNEYARAVEQLEYFCEVLEEEGVRVVRPAPITLEEALSRPVGNTQLYVREAFSVIGETVIVNQCRTPYRRKEARAAEALLDGNELVRLPPVPDDVEDSLPDDPLPYLEGGDVYRLGKDALITISGLASSPTGFRFVADLMAARGVDVWPAYLRPEVEHGDYVLMLVREGLCVAWRGAFVDGLLPSPILDWECINITQAESDPGLAANGIVLRKNLVVMPRGNPRVYRALERKGVDVIEVPFDGVAFFQGAIDCATNELRRGED